MTTKLTKITSNRSREGHLRSKMLNATVVLNAFIAVIGQWAWHRPPLCIVLTTRQEPDTELLPKMSVDRHII